MGIKKNTKTRAIEIRDFILNKVEAHPEDIVTFTADHFKISRVSAYRHVKKLTTENKLVQIGTTNNTSYSLTKSTNNELTYKISKTLSESDIWDKNFSFLKKELPPNVYEICVYGFTEMVNNAIDHSEGQNLKILFSRRAGSIMFMIFDDGVGIFNKIKNHYKLSDVKDSVLELTKGKVTTDSKRHSGEGIFFTSRAFDSFIIQSSGYNYLRVNPQHDWTLESKKNSESKKNTLIILTIKEDSKTKIQDIYNNYTDPETSKFNTTEILVKLSQVDDLLISRSQAKRVLSGLEKFEKIILDFKDVKSIGQAFVDETFRVFQNEYPDIQFNWINANEDIEFMIKRGISTDR